jgi:hypothetical protein
MPAAIALVALAWVVALTAGPWLPVPVAGVLYAAGSLICHQISERSFHLQSFQLPVCARCFGLYAGVASGSAAWAIVGRQMASFSGRGKSRYVLTCAAAVPTILTVILERGFGWPLSNSTRALAAVPLAGAVAFVVMAQSETPPPAPADTRDRSREAVPP